MDVILLERIEKLGAIGDVVKVKNGYARNFLLPRGKALRANEANRKVFEANRARIEADNAERRTDAEKHAGKVEGKQVVLIRASSNSGQLYGSVNVRDIADALNEQGANVTQGIVEEIGYLGDMSVYQVRLESGKHLRVTQTNTVRGNPDAITWDEQVYLSWGDNAGSVLTV